MSDDSVFKVRTLQDIYDEIQRVYMQDSRPWIIGFSGGKDSTCMVQLVWNAISCLPREKHHKNIYIISSDTLVEMPKIVSQITTNLEKMEKTSKDTVLPISTNLVRPLLQDRFWVCLLGRGYAAPTSNFRWCTDRLKIRNVDRFIRETVSRYGEAVVLLGTRKSESGSRQQLMNMYEIPGSLLSRHSKFAQTYVYTPIRDFTTQDVWNYLLQNKNPWGSQNRELLALYRDANAKECPLVVDTSTPSCGSGRFGCWTCTVVDKDKSMSNMIDNGEEWLEPLLELRDMLKETQNPEKWFDVREIKRRNGRVELFTDGSNNITPGPYKLEFCKKFLRNLLQAQIKIRKTGPDPDFEIIQKDELHEIQRIWRLERGDWENSVYAIYREVTRTELHEPQEDLGSFGRLEQDTLEEVCQRHGVQTQLVSKLLNAESVSQGMTRHSKVFSLLQKILSEEWREDTNEILQDLKQRKDEKQDLNN